jgi:hypothetical protein
MASFTFDGRIAATVRIRDKTYVLKGDTETAGSGRMRLKYHEPFDDAFVVGTMTELLAEIDAENTLQLAGKLNTAEWNRLKDQALALPGLGTIFQGVLDTEIRITDLELDLEAPGGASSTIGKGTIEIGIGFDARPAAPNNKVLGIALETVGLLLRFEYGS